MHIKVKHIFSFLLLFAALTLQAQLPKVKKPYPKGVPKKMKLGMSLQEAKTRFSNLSPAKQDYDFREVYVLDANHPEIKSFVLYFDADGNKPLYEIMIVYKDEQIPKQTASKIFGTPNFDSKEWRATYKKQTIWSWVFKEKLILVADIPQTEWSDSF